MCEGSHGQRTGRAGTGHRAAFLAGLGSGRERAGSAGGAAGRRCDPAQRAGPAERAGERGAARDQPADGRCGPHRGPAPAGQPDRLAAAGHPGRCSARPGRRSVRVAGIPPGLPAAVRPGGCAAGEFLLDGPDHRAAAGVLAVSRRHAALAALALGAVVVPGCRHRPVPARLRRHGDDHRHPGRPPRRRAAASLDSITHRAQRLGSPRSTRCSLPCWCSGRCSPRAWY